MKRIFLTADKSRLRAGWRLALQTILSFLFLAGAGILIGIALYITSPNLIEGFKNSSTPALTALSMIAEALAFTASIFLARRFFDKRSIASLGLTINFQALSDVLAGIVITFVQMSFIYLLMRAFGWVTFQGFAWNFDPPDQVVGNALLFLFIFLLVGWSEELLSRGYHLQTLASGLNLFWGVAISSVIFGFLHIFNPDASWAAALGTALAGLFFAFAYLRTKQLWLPIGLHIGWNFFEGVGFGFPVSGLTIYPLTRIEVSGPELWTGGGFGPEAGLIVLPALIIGVSLIILLTRSQCEQQPKNTSAIE
ncbi:MAG: CPBP family intramembrane metalloprotease [Anaerolineales bacterium]|nr:CPBP family intramembrane metalloprotease [Anaerolineales bacterium]